MLVAIITVHWANGFFMNWYGNQKGEGLEYHLLVLGIAVTLMIVGLGHGQSTALWQASASFHANAVARAAGR